MENKVKFYAVIVIYNTEISQSETCNNICKILNHDIEVIIVDNSIITNKCQILPYFLTLKNL